MRKDKLLKLVKKNKKKRGSKAFFCFMETFQEFLESESIKSLPKKTNISFKDFSGFLKQYHPGVLTNPLSFNWMSSRLIRKFLNQFLKEEERKAPFISSNTLRYELHTIFRVENDASALAILPNGNFLRGTCYFNENGFPTGGGIFLHDSNGNMIKTLTDEPASALAVLPDGNIISGTCYFDQYGLETGGCIVLRNSNGTYLKTLIEEPASALAVLPDGDFLSSTCYFDLYCISRRGTIVLRDSDGKWLNTLVNKPASGLAVLPDGNFLSSTFYVYKDTDSDEEETGIDLEDHMVTEGSIVLCDENGYYLETVSHTPTSSLALLPNGNILTGTSYFNDFDFNEKMGKVECNRLKLIAKNKIPHGLIDDIYDSIIDRAALACIQFHKGLEDPTSNVAKLHRDVLPIIYSYVFPFPEGDKAIILNPYGLPPSKNNIKSELLANAFAKKIANIKFFQKPNIANDSKDISEDPPKIHPSRFKNCVII